MSTSKMSENFHEWLSECPVQWFRGGEENGYINYSFAIDEEE